MSCGTLDPAEIGRADFLYSGEFSAADSNIECDPGEDSEVSTLILTHLDGVTPPYGFPFNGRGVVIPGGVIEEGTYQVTLENNLGFSATMPSTIDLLPGQSNRLTSIYYFEADELTDPSNPDDIGIVTADYYRCDDPERAGETDFSLSTEINGGAKAENCTLAGTGEAGLVLSGTSLGDGTFDPQTIVSSPGGEFTFESFCFGTYTLTDLATGIVYRCCKIQGG